MKNQKLKKALSKFNASNEFLSGKSIEFLDSQKANQIRGGIATTKLSSSPSSDSCGKVFSCGLYHVV